MRNPIGMRNGGTALAFWRHVNRRLAVAVTVGAVALLLLAACGTSGGSDDEVASLDDARTESTPTNTPEQLEATGTPSEEDAEPTATDTESGTAEGAVFSGDQAGERTPEEALLDFATCMRGHGVDFPDPVFTEDGNPGYGAVGGAQFDPSDPNFQVAQQACSHELEGVAFGDENQGSSDGSARQDVLVEFAQCLRDEGIDVPDPEFWGLDVSVDGNVTGRPGGEPFGGIDLQDPEVQAAFQSCEHILDNLSGVDHGGP